MSRFFLVSSFSSSSFFSPFFSVAFVSDFARALVLSPVRLYIHWHVLYVFLEVDKPGAVAENFSGKYRSARPSIVYEPLDTEKRERERWRRGEFVTQRRDFPCLYSRSRTLIRRKTTRSILSRDIMKARRDRRE